MPGRDVGEPRRVASAEDLAALNVLLVTVLRMGSRGLSCVEIAARPPPPERVYQLTLDSLPSERAALVGQVHVLIGEVFAVDSGELAHAAS